MKFIAYLMLIALMLSLFTACGAPAVQPDNRPESSQAPAVGQEALVSPAAEETAPPEEEPAEADVLPEAYKEMLDRYRLAVSEQRNAGQLMEDELNTLCVYCYEGEPLENIGYLVRDLDGDGTPELLIGTVGGDNFTYLLLFDLYTLSDGEAAPLFQGWERSRWYMLEDGRFYNYGAAGAGYSFGSVYLLSGGELVFDQGLAAIGVADDISEYYDMIGEEEQGEQLSTEEGETRFAAWANGRIQPNFIPLANYQ